VTVNGNQPTGLYFIFGWRGPRGDDGPYYAGGASTVDQAIAEARSVLPAWTRTTADDVRSGERVFDSAAPDPAPRPRHLTRQDT
jgi:hypothetical protein